LHALVVAKRNSDGQGGWVEQGPTYSNILNGQRAHGLLIDCTCTLTRGYHMASRQQQKTAQVSNAPWVVCNSAYKHSEVS